MAQSGAFARAVETPVLRTCAARFGHALLERFACPEHSDTGVVGRQSLLPGERLDGCAARDFNRFECLGVFRLQSGGKSRHAGADLRLHVVRGCFVRFKLTCEGLERTISSSKTSKLIDRSAPQRAIEPRDDGFVRGCLLWTPNHRCERVLQHILGEGRSPTRLSKERRNAR
jgi:hypothetical protein